MSRQVRETARVQLQRGTPVSGVEPELARSLARACHDWWSSADRVGYRVKMPPEEVAPLLDQLVEGGYLERREERQVGGAGTVTEWYTTLAGGALTMASFLKPIPRAKADKLLAGVIERAVAYNADDDKPYVITEVAAFGSYARPDVTELGDLDLTVKYTHRSAEFEDPKRLLAFARASGRTFRKFTDELFWPLEDMLRTLRARSGYINVHTEDVTTFDANVQVVYSHEAPVTDAR